MQDIIRRGETGDWWEGQDTCRLRSIQHWKLERPSLKAVLVTDAAHTSRLSSTLRCISQLSPRIVGRDRQANIAAADNYGLGI
jgi:hypothetical protein